jgi:hypothetical protein
VATHTRRFFLASSQALTNNALDATERKEEKKNTETSTPIGTRFAFTCHRQMNIKEEKLPPNIIIIIITTTNTNNKNNINI